MNKKTFVDTMTKVKRMLEEQPDMRDNDQRLIISFWYRQLKHRIPKGAKPIDIFSMLANTEDLTSAETITRARRKLQEQHFGLRGKRYRERHNVEHDTRQMFLDM